MPGFPQARITDIHTCTVPVPPFPSPILPPGAVTVLVGKLPAARALVDMALTGSPPVPPVPHPFPKGSLTVLINNMPALRMLDTCAQGGPIIKGEFTVLTG
ncbi:PAAR domain-containing protein [Ostreiculturibacter nitratireducens]|uniref:PAAR domain-containing protein n=1 Tax=Ostreiculturibacter nitratireducens TaxID=3075226 RepID=UPI0031B5AC16